MNGIEHNNLQKILKERNHRPYSLPEWPWVTTQRWENVLFLHWQFSPNVLKPHIPKQLQLDLYDAAAWIGIVFFQVKGMRLRSMPALPRLSSFLQLNVRTYVTYNGLPGVYFFSLDVDSKFACLLAKTIYSLPFRRADVKLDRQGDYMNMVYARKKGSFAGEMSCSYAPVSAVFQAQINTFDHWLLERYCLWNIRKNDLWRTDIHHTKWNFQKAEVILHSHSMAGYLHRKSFLDHPLVHYAAMKQALFWLPVKEESLFFEKRY